MGKRSVLAMLAIVCTASFARAEGSAMSTCDQNPRCFGRELAVALTTPEPAITLRRLVDFEPGRVRVYSKSREKIQALVQRWKQRADWSVITVDGYAADNLELAQRRADKIRGYLIRYGVPPALVVAKGHTGAATVDLSIDLCRGYASCPRTAMAQR
jgi:outer membrane protein OmpA-like peptidoglycan-associated protein